MPYPYARGSDGYLEPVLGHGGQLDDGYDYGVPRSERRLTSLQVGVEGVPPLGGPGRAQARVRFLTVYRLDFDLAYGAFFDRNDAGGASAAATGNVHVSGRIPQTERLMFHLGLGMRHWADGRGSVFGLDWIYGIDVFWGHHGPITTSLEMTGGTLGSGAVAEPRGTIGVLAGVGEIYAGYDAMWVFGAGNLPTAYLGGPVAGVRAYF
jgi:hypothetical protein